MKSFKTPYQDFKYHADSWLAAATSPLFALLSAPLRLAQRISCYSPKNPHNTITAWSTRPLESAAIYLSIHFLRRLAFQACRRVCRCPFEISSSRELLQRAVTRPADSQ
ncbi:hypothetical protein K432DRAFT_3777 [Lepidopterella palustris CBS 459.81]|uniref:Uncharacterized protein n=1 Tax=Lepidopterella palustris CBS 459.81 TaxID=1314670 RepID=A0A8E2EDB5_9PEZI|nr:hypothetical protein K432DRAFT_3777 [Lepidopterella palustris CBS 459.81]